MDEIRLRLSSQKRLQNCCLLMFTETWLNSNIADSAVELAGRTAFRADRTADSGKIRGGGLSIYVNNSWCNNIKIVERHCSADLELLMIQCRPFYLPRELTAITIAAVYIPPHANAKVALKQLQCAISRQQTKHPDNAFIIGGDFNQANLRAVLPKFHQHVSCPTRGQNTLDHLYTNIKDSYKATPCPHLGHSDHLCLFLVPAYKPLIKRVKPAVKTITVWPEGAVSELQDCFDNTDWSIFAHSATHGSHIDINEQTSAILAYINFCTESVTTKKSVRTFPNQKPWMTSEVRQLLKVRDAAFKSGNCEAYSAARSNLKKGIRTAKHKYSLRIEDHFHNNSDPRRMWQGIQSITDYKSSNSGPTVHDASLPDKLNHFYARFDKDNTDPATKIPSHPENQVLTLSVAEVRESLRRVNTRKAAGPDGIPGWVYRECADQLAEVFTPVFNLSLSQSKVPACFKTTSIIPVSKKPTSTCLNDYRPIALTPIAMKCFERLVLAHIKNIIPPTFDPHQFAYRPKRSTEDAIATALHVALTHLELNNTYIRMLFIDYSSAFNTIIPAKLTTKLLSLGLNPSLCNWILDFLTNRPQSVRLGDHSSSTLTLSTGAPQGCVLSPLLFSLFTHDCLPTHPSNVIVKFADDTTVIGRITNNDEMAYRDEIEHLTSWCTTNNLVLNVQKTKELIVDFRRSRSCSHSPIHINGVEVERVSSFKFLGVHISEDLSWTLNTQALVKKAQQRLHFLRRLRSARLPPKILTNFYHCTIESILTICISVWYGNCTSVDQKALQRVVKAAQHITGTQLPAIKDIYHKRCLRRGLSISRDPTHPNHGLFSPLRSGRRYRSLRARTTRLKNSFFPQAVAHLNLATH